MGLCSKRTIFASPHLSAVQCSSRGLWPPRRLKIVAGFPSAVRPGLICVADKAQTIAYCLCTLPQACENAHGVITEAQEQRADLRKQLSGILAQHLQAQDKEQTEQNQYDGLGLGSCKGLILLYGT